MDLHNLPIEPTPDWAKAAPKSSPKAEPKTIKTVAGSQGSGSRSLHSRVMADMEDDHNAIVGAQHDDDEAAAREFDSSQLESSLADINLITDQLTILASDLRDMGMLNAAVAVEESRDALEFASDEVSAELIENAKLVDDR